MLSHKHEPHPDCPDTLACLPDTDGRPQHTLPVILRCAILGSARKRLTIREIYAAMEGKYPYYQTAGPTWKQSVRHHLSLNRLFERQPRPVADPGFGSYWTVNLSAPPGTKRPRKRGRPNKDIHDDTGPPPVKRRGRPRKNPINHGSMSQSTTESPRPQRPSHTSSTITTDHFEEDEDDDEEDILPSEEKDNESHISDEEYESEEDMVYPFDRHVSRNRLRARGHSNQTSAFGNESSNHLIDRLKIEMAGLRRQSAEAVSLSLRMSDQLAEAQAEASRARAALRAAESMLEDEGRKRREAENAADAEARRRRAAEEALRVMRVESS